MLLGYPLLVESVLLELPLDRTQVILLLRQLVLLCFCPFAEIIVVLRNLLKVVLESALFPLHFQKGIVLAGLYT